ncbi:MAG: mycofactocin biosynthesis peptidyl-dipeptidase MftE [Actinomycetaceae bacterium]
MRLADATWPDVADLAAGRRPVLVVPLGSLEQHGPHLPLDTDAVTATAVSEAVVAARPGAALAPTIAIGAADEHADFPGTLSLGTDVLRDVLVRLARSSSPTFGAVLVINGHGGNAAAIRAAIAVCAAERRILARHHVGLPRTDAHAGHNETSLLFHLAPERVLFDRAETGNTTPLAEIIDELRTDGVRALSPNGVLGDPRTASAEKGAAMFSALLDQALTAFDDVAAQVA